MSKKYDFITMGSGLVDAYIKTGVKENLGKISFSISTKISVKNIEFSTGGGGTNTATTLSHLGFKTGFLGKIGHGNNADIILRELKKNKVDFLGIQSKEHTGYSIVLQGHKKHRTILTFKGSSDNLKNEEINYNKLNTKWIHFTSMADNSFKSQKKVMEYAYKKGIKTSFNPSSYQTKLGVRHLGNLIKKVHVLSMNKEEAQMCVKKGDLFKGLRKMGPEIVIITNGSREGGVYDGKFLYKFWPNKVKIQTRTGAGDVFSASFVGGLLKTKDVEKAIKIAMANAESKVTQKGTKNGLLSWKEVTKLIKKKRFNIKKELI